jgi:hypothetical protein
MAGANGTPNPKRGAEIRPRIGMYRPWKTNKPGLPPIAASAGTGRAGGPVAIRRCRREAVIPCSRRVAESRASDLARRGASFKEAV